MFKTLTKLRISCLKRVATDQRIIEAQYQSAYGQYPNLIHPRTFDEKIQWYKLHYRKPLLTQLADKHRVREYVVARGLGHILNDLYGVYTSVDQIDLTSLPEAFVMKATHGSGMSVFCKNRRDFDWKTGRRQLKRWLKKDHYRSGREWAYKDIPPRIICEKYLENEEHGELIDYKFYCFGGKPEIVFVCSGRFKPGGVRYDCYDMAWNKLPLHKGRPAGGLNLDRPRRFDEMVAVAKNLAAEFPFVRVDVYLVKERIIFGEMTFYPDNGIVPFSPPEYNIVFGDCFVVPEGSQ